jgi:hypothetical protein
LVVQSLVVKFMAVKSVAIKFVVERLVKQPETAAQDGQADGDPSL